jgi:hypothetical protein
MKYFFRRWTGVIMLVLAPVTSVFPLHELDHRYDVAGYILDAERRPIADVAVVAQVHLHDSDLGRELRLKTPDYAGTVRVTLTPGDTSTERIHHVNFIDGKLVEGELQERGGVSNSTLIALGTGLLIVGGVFAVEKMRRRRRRAARQAKRARADKGSPRGKRKGKSRRRKK